MGLLYSTEDFQVFGCVAPWSRQLHEDARRCTHLLTGFEGSMTMILQAHDQHSHQADHCGGRRGCERGCCPLSKLGMMTVIMLAF